MRIWCACPEFLGYLDFLQIFWLCFNWIELIGLPLLWVYMLVFFFSMELITLYHQWKWRILFFIDFKTSFFWLGQTNQPFLPTKKKIYIEALSLHSKSLLYFSLFSLKKIQGFTLLKFWFCASTNYSFNVWIRGWVYQLIIWI